MAKSKEPTLISEPQAEYGREFYSKIPPEMLIDSKIIPIDIRIYGILDFLAGKRGWWYAPQDEILDYFIKRFMEMTDIKKIRPISYFSASTIQRSVKRLRNAGYIITEQTGIESHGTLKYFILARHPDIPTYLLKKGP